MRIKSLTIKQLNPEKNQIVPYNLTKEIIEETSVLYREEPIYTVKDADGNELWFSRDYGIWRSRKVKGEWGEPEKMFWPLAGEPSIDRIGNVYFTHHFFKDVLQIPSSILY